MSVQYVPISVLEEEEAGKELPRAYFPMTQGNRMVLYQDAETQPLPQVSSFPLTVLLQLYDEYMATL